MNKICECGHPRREHEKLQKQNGITVVPCMKFTKGENGINASVCACKGFVEQHAKPARV